MPPPFEEWWRGIKCYPCPCVRPCVRPLSKFGVRSITFERLHWLNSNLVCWYNYNIRTQVKFNLGDNPLISPLPVFTPEGTIGLPSVRPSVRLSVRQSVSLSVCLSVCLSAINLDPLITFKLFKLGAWNLVCA